MTDKRYGLGLFLVVLSALCYAANSTSSVVAYGGGASPLSLVTFRNVFAAAALYCYLRSVGVPIAMAPRDRAVSLALGILLSIYSYCLVEAFDRLPVALAVITFYLYPIFIGVTAFAIGLDRPSWALGVGLVAAFIGLVFALGVTAGGLDPWGIVLAATAAASFSALAVIAAPIIARYGDPRPLVFYGHMTAAVVMIAATVLTWDYPLPTTPRSVVAFFIVPLFYTVASVSFFAAMFIIGTVRTGLVMNIEPLAAIVFGFSVLDQVLTPVQLFGAALVIVAVSVVKWESGRRSQTAA